jgi:hypothetical protein
VTTDSGSAPDRAETEEERSARHERERIEANERYEQDRQASHEIHERERLEARERRVDERNAEKDA